MLSPFRVKPRLTDSRPRAIMWGYFVTIALNLDKARVHLKRMHTHTHAHTRTHTMKHSPDAHRAHQTSPTTSVFHWDKGTVTSLSTLWLAKISLLI